MYKTNRITWKERHLSEINSEALNNYFYTFFIVVIVTVSIVCAARWGYSVSLSSLHINSVLDTQPFICFWLVLQRFHYMLSMVSCNWIHDCKQPFAPPNIYDGTRGHLIVNKKQCCSIPCIYNLHES